MQPQQQLTSAALKQSILCAATAREDRLLQPLDKAHLYNILVNGFECFADDQFESLSHLVKGHALLESATHQLR